MTTFKDLRDKFDADVAELQAKCPHLESDWMDSEWAPGHYNGRVQVCRVCEKILERSNETPLIVLRSQEFSRLTREEQLAYIKEHSIAEGKDGWHR